MTIEEQRKAFDRWVLTHPDNLDLTAYEENIMFEAWLASANREGYKLVPVEPTLKMLEGAADEHVAHGASYAGIYKAMIEAFDN